MEGEVGAAACLRRREAKRLAALHRVRAVGREGLPVQGGTEVSAGEPDYIVRRKAERGAKEGTLERGFILRISAENIGKAQGAGVHGAGDRDAEGLIADAAQVLNRCQSAGGNHLDAHALTSSRLRMLRRYVPASISPSIFRYSSSVIGKK